MKVDIGNVRATAFCPVEYSSSDAEKRTPRASEWRRPQLYSDVLHSRRVQHQIRVEGNPIHQLPDQDGLEHCCPLCDSSLYGCFTWKSSREKRGASSEFFRHCSYRPPGSSESEPLSLFLLYNRMPFKQNLPKVETPRSLLCPTSPFRSPQHK